MKKTDASKTHFAPKALGNGGNDVLPSQCPNVKEENSLRGVVGEELDKVFHDLFLKVSGC
jgi:hypothetical protein